MQCLKFKSKCVSVIVNLVQLTRECLNWNIGQKAFSKMWQRKTNR